MPSLLFYFHSSYCFFPRIRHPPGQSRRWAAAAAAAAAPAISSGSAWTSRPLNSRALHQQTENRKANAHQHQCPHLALRSHTDGTFCGTRAAPRRIITSNSSRTTKWSPAINQTPTRVSFGGGGGVLVARRTPFSFLLLLLLLALFCSFFNSLSFYRIIFSSQN